MKNRNTIYFIMILIIGLAVVSGCKKQVSVNQNVNQGNINVDNNITWKFWRMSSSILMLKIPSEWNIEQNDSGGMSSIFVGKFIDQQRHILRIDIIDSRIFGSDEVLNFMDWVNNDSLKNEKIKDDQIQENVEIANIKALKSITIDEEVLLYINLKKVFIKIKYLSKNEEKLNISTIINSIIFYPTEKQIMNTNIIP